MSLSVEVNFCVEVFEGVEDEVRHVPLVATLGSRDELYKLENFGWSVSLATNRGARHACLRFFSFYFPVFFFFVSTKKKNKKTKNRKKKFK